MTLSVPFQVPHTAPFAAGLPETGGFCTFDLLEQAQFLLRTTNLPINQAAKRVGFRNTFHFSRFFQQQTGMLPSGGRQGTPFN